MKTYELTGAALDWAVAKCEGVEVNYDRDNGWYETADPRYAEPNDPHVYSPSTDWAQGGEIIEREMIELVPVSGALWDAYKKEQHIPNDGATPLVAAMRCYVASKLGDEVDVLQELLK